MMDTRKLLCFDPTGIRKSIIDTLNVEGWEIMTVTQYDEAKNLIQSHSFHVGMVLFSSFEQEELLSIQHLLEIRYPIEWIALLPPQESYTCEIRRLIVQRFYDYHTLPFDTKRMQYTLGHAYGMALMMRRLRSEKAYFSAESMMGSSPTFIAMVSRLEKIVHFDLPILISGEIGSGKETAARAIHQQSFRANHPFVIISCSAIPSILMESELLGYETFLGNCDHSLPKKGRMESASGGTLYLDEIGDLPLNLQAALLRLIHEKTLCRMRSTEQVPADVRVIASTHTPLEVKVANGQFLPELYKTLSDMTIRIPPLRERKEDIELLARYYLNLFWNERHEHINGFTREALATMRDYEWPGNIRELINRIRRSLLMCEDDRITPADLGLLPNSHTDPSVPILSSMTLGKAKDEAEKKIIEITLQSTENNISLAAKKLDVSRMTLYRLMQKHRIHTCTKSKKGNENVFF